MTTQSAAEQRQGTEGLVSWGRSVGKMVKDGAAHVRADEHYVSTRCGLAIPPAVRQYLLGAGPHWGVRTTVWPNDAQDSAALPRCRRCARGR